MPRVSLAYQFLPYSLALPIDSLRVYWVIFPLRRSPATIKNIICRDLHNLSPNIVSRYREVMGANGIHLKGGYLIGLAFIDVGVSGTVNNQIRFFHHYHVTNLP